MAAESEFADYLTMESFFTAESAMASQQNGFSANQQNQQHQQHQQAADYLITMDQQQYEYQQNTAMAVDPLHINQTTPEKFEFHNNNSNNHNNNNSVQYFYESNNSVQQQILQQPQHQIHQTSEFYVSHKVIIIIKYYW